MSVSPPPPPLRKGPNPFLLAGLFVLTTAAFYVTVNYRATNNPASKYRRQADNPLVPPPRREDDSKSEGGHAEQTAPATSPVFDASKITVLFVLGGPGAGKGTQCANLVKDFGFCHLSAGDLLRAEQNRPGSTYGDMIRTYIKEGQIVPMEVTIKLLENAMKDTLAEGREGEGWADGRGRFLIDGFPRKMDQAIMFDEQVCQSSTVLFFTTTEDEMLKRLIERGKTSGREDDNEESIRKRFRVYKEQTMPVIEHYNKLGKVAEIDSSATIEEVHEKAKTVVGKIFSGETSRNLTT
ncbi:UMP-CMP kinase [Steccherinum ochraceum]|uniref:Uridylate kinase n=1 Tax=Steccherinum ochraceum TaxID=92696 RepID=A0A4R0RDR1_9APHY|nr:UMP-CMP kinase [Steccherinum ochraceum]